MKKSLIALAVMAAAGAASAQSSVTLFGIVDAGFVYGKASGPGGNHRSRIEPGNYSTSRIGFRGREDLGGNMYASFWLEGQLFNDYGGAGTFITTNNQTLAGADGTGLNFTRRATVELGGRWGEVRLGRDIHPGGVVPAAYDPFGTLGVGGGLATAQQATGLGVAANATVPTFGSATGTTRGILARASNMIQYVAPGNLGGFFGSAAYWLGENRSNVGVTSDDGDGGGIRLGFGTGPFQVQGSWTRTEYATTAVLGDYTSFDIGGQWDFGVARLMGFYRSDEIERTGADLESRGWNIGALVPVGPGEIRVSYGSLRITNGVASEPRARKIALGYVHNLSKRTALYTTVAHVRNRSGAAIGLGGAGGPGWALNQNSTGFELGVRHAF